MRKVETKVTAGSVSAAVAGVVLWVLQTYAFKGTAVPAGIQSLIYVAVPGMLALLAGYLAPHTPVPAPLPVPPSSVGGYNAGAATVSGLPPPPASVTAQGTGQVPPGESGQRIT